MDYQQSRQTKAFKALPLSLRLASWWLSRRRPRNVIPLDPRTMPESLLKDIGLDSPSESWDETTAFWRR
jgi:hypothetical protein